MGNKKWIQVLGNKIQLYCIQPETNHHATSNMSRRATGSRSDNKQILGSLLGTAAHMDTAPGTIKEQMFEIS